MQRVDMHPSLSTSVCRLPHFFSFVCVNNRQLIEDEGAVGPLVDLLSSSDVQCQACAAGALYNLLIQSVEEKGNVEQFKAMLSDTIVLGMVRSCLDEEKEGE